MNDRPKKYDCVIYDMDGTLTEDHLDFNLIRTEMGVADGEGILEWLAVQPPEARRRAEEILLSHEMAAARASIPAAGAVESVRAIQAAGLKTALLTRNTRPAMELVLERLGLSFDLCYSREDGSIKPAPDSILQACGELRVRPERVLCVGDWLYDIEAANAAGCTSVLLMRGRRLSFAESAHHTIESMTELAAIVLGDGPAASRGL